MLMKSLPGMDKMFSGNRRFSEIDFQKVFSSSIPSICIFPKTCEFSKINLRTFRDKLESLGKFK